MYTQLASNGAPSYFIPHYSREPEKDYRSGLLRNIAGTIQQVATNFSAEWKGGVTTLLGIWAISSNLARVELFIAQFETIERLKVHPANWSTLSVIAPNDAQCLIANKALLALLVAGVPAPQIMLLADGTLGGFWRQGDMYASIDFDADGEFPWTAAVDGKVTSSAWVLGKPIPYDLQYAISG